MSVIPSFQRRVSEVGQLPDFHRPSALLSSSRVTNTLQPVAHHVGQQFFSAARNLSQTAAARLSGGARKLPQAEVLRRYDQIRLKRGEHWVDIGSGDGHTLGEIGKRNPHGEVVGFDFDGAPVLEIELARKGAHLRQLPENSRYIVMYSSHFYQSSTPYPGRTERIVLQDSADRDESMSARARRAIVEQGGSAKVVSVFFPFVHRLHDKSTAYFAHDASQITYMTVADKIMRLKSAVTLESRRLMDSMVVELETALEALSSGGTGIVMTESESARHLLVKWLAANQQVKDVVYHDESIDVQAMHSVGIREHVIPTGLEKDVVLDDGYMIIFTKK